ncbi:T9SS type A sorting domain-containing protein [bacterium]
MDVKTRLVVFWATALLISIFPTLNAQDALYEPAEWRTYHGVGWGSSGQTAYHALFPDSLQPLLYQNIFSIPGNVNRPLTVNALLGHLAPNHMDPDMQFAELSVHFADTSQILDSAFAFTDQYDHYIDTLAEAFQLHDRPFFFRIGLEMNGDWNGYTPWIFPAAFRKLVQELKVRGVNTFASVWCYEPDAISDFADSTEQGWKWYPGDDVVDWFGLDLFDADHFDPDEPDSTGGRITKKGRSEAFLRFAMERSRPVYLNELSARNVFITPDAQDPDSSDGKHDWDYWFKPFFKFLSEHPNVKAFNYINLNWTLIPQYAHWGDARLEINSTIREGWLAEMKNTRFLHKGTDILNPTGILMDYSVKNSAPGQNLITAHPNPFNAATQIQFFLSKNENIQLIIYNLRGQHIHTLYNGDLPAEQHTFQWVPDNLPAGMYFVQLKTGTDISIRKVILLK